MIIEEEPIVYIWEGMLTGNDIPIKVAFNKNGNYVPIFHNSIQVGDYRKEWVRPIDNHDSVHRAEIQEIWDEYLQPKLSPVVQSKIENRFIALLKE